MIKQVHKSSAVDHNSWTLKFDHFTNYHHYSPLSRIAYENRYVTHPLPIFNSYLFNRIKIVPIYAHESSKPISLIKRRIEYLTKALYARFSKIIMFFKFLLEKVSRRFENDYIHEIEYS